MIVEEIKTKWEEIKEKWDNLKEILKPEKLEEEIKQLDDLMADPNFWNDTKKAQEISSRRNYLGEKLEEILTVDKKVNNLLDYITLLEMEEDQELYNEVEKELKEIEKEISRLELGSLLSDEMDSKMQSLLFRLAQVELKLATGQRCYLECIQDGQKREVIKLSL
jgi:Protein chain release factor A